MNSRPYVGYFAIFIALGLTISSLIEPSDKSKFKKTQKRLNEHTNSITDFHSFFKRLPNNLAELRAFAVASEKNYSTYDGWNNRFVYQKLSESIYTIQAFHESYNRPLATSSNFEPLPKGIPIDNVSKSTVSRLYPALFVSGLASGSGKLIARLYINHEKRKKRLVVRSRVNEDIIYTAFHDQVDEFLWVQDQPIILYSTAKSESYKQGLYLWNLKTGQTFDLLPAIQKKNPRLNQEMIHLALSSIFNQKDSTNIYLFAHEMTGYGISPMKLFSEKNHFKLSISDLDHTENLGIESHIQLSQDLIKLSQASEEEKSYIRSGGYPEQESWDQLSTAGSIDEIIDQWQRYTIKHTESPMTPYSLMWISIFYAQASQETTDMSETDAFILKSLGIELSGTLEHHVMTPSYLTAISRWVKKQLSENLRLELKAVKFRSLSPLQLESSDDNE